MSFYKITSFTRSSCQITTLAHNNNNNNNNKNLYYKKETRPETKRPDLQFPTYIYLLCIYKTK